MNLLKYLIPVALVIIGIFLIKYDRNKEVKNRHIVWLSRHLFRNSSGVNASAVRLHQTILGFLFIFCVGIGILFIIGLIEG